MKLPSFLTLSLVGNLMLAAIFVVARQHSLVETSAPAATFAAATSLVAKPLHAADGTPEPVVPWRQIASADYRQYIANLRAVGCPEWLIRDIIVADIDDLYQQKTRTDPVSFAPWQGADERRKFSRSRSAKLDTLSQEKRTLVKSLLGYEWDNHADEVWSWDLLTSLTLGFLPDDRAAQVLSLDQQFDAAAQTVREDANYILIDEDRARLRSLYEALEAGLAQQLDAGQLDELQLRKQQGFLVANDIHFAGVTISREELRELVRMSKSFKDVARNDFVSERPLSDAEEAQGKAAFEAQVRNLLGAGRFADYQRAQDYSFREIFEFSQENQLPVTAAIKVYASRRNAAEQAEEIQKDATLSADDRAAALGVLKAVTVNSISSALGGSYQSYLAGAGQWLETLAQPPAATAQ